MHKIVKRRGLYGGASAALLGVLLVAGCSHRIGQFTALSTRNVPLVTSAGARVQGKSCRHYVFGFFGAGDQLLEDAVDEALEEGRGQLLLDVVIYSSDWKVPFIWGKSCFTVEGSVVSFRGRDGSASNRAGEDLVRELLQMADADLPEDVLIAHARKRPATLTGADLVALAEAGISPDVLRAIAGQEQRKR